MEYKNKIILLTLLLVSFSFGFCQINDKESLIKESQLKANIDIIGINMSYEKKIGKSMTAYLDGGLTYGFYANSGILTFGPKQGFALAPIISVSARKYYNLEKRLNKRKKIENNSANFINLRLGYRFAPLVSKNMYANGVIAFEPTWGLQRNIGQNFSFEVAPGIAFLYDPVMQARGTGLTLNVRFGYLLF